MTLNSGKPQLWGHKTWDWNLLPARTFPPGRKALLHEWCAWRHRHALVETDHEEAAFTAAQRCCQHDPHPSHSPRAHSLAAVAGHRRAHVRLSLDHVGPPVMPTGLSYRLAQSTVSGPWLQSGVPHGHCVPSRRLAPSELQERVGSACISLSQARPEPSGKLAYRPFRGAWLGFPQNCVVSPVLRRTQMLTQPLVGPISPRAAQQLKSDRRSPAERPSQHTRILGRAPQSPGHLHNVTQTSSQQPLLLFKTVIWPCKWRVQGSTGAAHIIVFMESGCKQDPQRQRPALGSLARPARWGSLRGTPVCL